MLSLIICTYNRDKYLYDALKHIAENDFPVSDYEIVLINNNSTDNTEAESACFEQDFPQVDFRYFMEKKQGLSYARNRGIAEARGEILVFLDDDSFVRPNYLRRLSENLKKYPDVNAFGGKITPRYESGIAPKWISRWSYSWVSAIDLGNEVRLFPDNSFPIGANMGLTKRCIDRVGLFNTQLGRTAKNLMGGEEKDIFNRIKDLGGKIYYFPDIEVEHVIPESRTTTNYIRKMAFGVGISERMRTLNISTWAYFKRLFLEKIKWVGTLVLFVRFLFKLQPEKGSKLIYFRWFVTRGLLSRKKAI
ncbi:MAG: glycosyltransferase [Prevotellaceae bacterium]|jgi:glycosyltransferase involved in cell wall biosynthesis|nr:glycosyltransferase [Prevotellaceae bacterium]